MSTFRFLFTLIFLLCLTSCGVKKPPTPAYDIPLPFMTDGVSPSPSPKAKHE